MAAGLITYALAPHIYGNGSLKQGSTSYKLAQTGTYTFAPPEKPALILRPWQAADVDVEATFPMSSQTTSCPTASLTGLSARTQGLSTPGGSGGSNGSSARQGPPDLSCGEVEGGTAAISSHAKRGQKPDEPLTQWPSAASVE